MRHPARLVLVGTGNPEEGELRPQLLDRFGLSVEVRTPTELPVRIEVVRRRDAFERDPEGFRARWAKDEARQRKRIVEARARLPGVGVPDAALERAARLCIALGTEPAERMDCTDRMDRTDRIDCTEPSGPAACGRGLSVAAAMLAPRPSATTVTPAAAIRARGHRSGGAEPGSGTAATRGRKRRRFRAGCRRPRRVRSSSTAVRATTTVGTRRCEDRVGAAARARSSAQRSRATARVPRTNRHTPPVNATAAATSWSDSPSPSPTRVRQPSESHSATPISGNPRITSTWRSWTSGSPGLGSSRSCPGPVDQRDAGAAAGDERGVVRRVAGREEERPGLIERVAGADEGGEPGRDQGLTGPAHVVLGRVGGGARAGRVGDGRPARVAADVGEVVKVALLDVGQDRDRPVRPERLGLVADQGVGGDLRRQPVGIGDVAALREGP